MSAAMGQTARDAVDVARGNGDRQLGREAAAGPTAGNAADVPVDRPASTLLAPGEVFYAAACALVELHGVPPRGVELFRDDVADPEAVDTLGDRDPGVRIDLRDIDAPADLVAALARALGLQHVWSQIADQIPRLSIVSVPIRGSIE